MDWQPIETAPRDGTMFLTTGMAGFNIVHYQRPYKPAKRWFLVECQGRVGSADTLQERECTHWMPLPPKPTRDS